MAITDMLRADAASTVIDGSIHVALAAGAGSTKGVPARSSATASSGRGADRHSSWPGTLTDPAGMADDRWRAARTAIRAAGDGDEAQRTAGNA